MDAFKVIVPADIKKSDDGEWVVEGVASTASRDRQGEVLLQDGIDATPITEGRAFFNWDHNSGPENTLGPIDSYKRKDGNFIVKGRLFKNHAKAKAVHEIMSSLGKSDRGRMGMSVEGKILERGADGKTIKKCVINAVALTMNPVNQDSHADLVKSLTGAVVDFQTITPVPEETGSDSFSASEVAKIVKALTVGSGYAEKTPSELSGGEALATEDLDKKPTKKKKIKKMCKSEYQDGLGSILNKLQELYPNNSRSELWEAVKDRLNTRYDMGN